MLWSPKGSKIREYRKVRELGRLLNDKIIKVIPKEVIDRTARDMRMLVKGILVLDSTDELGNLFDRIIYDVPWNGKTSIEHFEMEKDSELSPIEEKLLEAMKGAYFSLFEVVSGVAGEFLQLSDLLSDGQIKLTDVSMSSTASNGLLLATRIIEFEDIFMSSGVTYPFLPEQKDALISGLQARRTAQRRRKKRSVRRIDFSDPRNYSLYFFRQYRKFGAMETMTSEEF